VEDSTNGWGNGRLRPQTFKYVPTIRRIGSMTIVYIVLAVLFVAGLWAYVKVRSKRLTSR
jgi:hypothetical protein